MQFVKFLEMQYWRSEIGLQKRTRLQSQSACQLAHSLPNKTESWSFQSERWHQWRPGCPLLVLQQLAGFPLHPTPSLPPLSVKESGSASTEITVCSGWNYLYNWSSSIFFYFLENTENQNIFHLSCASVPYPEQFDTESNIFQVLIMLNSSSPVQSGRYISSSIDELRSSFCIKIMQCVPFLLI